MQLSMFSDYALRVLVHLAASPDRLMTARQIAQIHDAKYNHLSKVTNWLVNEGYCSSQRGRGGGLRLLLAPKNINIGEVLAKLEDDKPLVECLSSNGGDCCLSTACGLSGALREAQTAFFQVLGKYTLDDISTSSPMMSRLLDTLNASVIDTPSKDFDRS